MNDLHPNNLDYLTATYAQKIIKATPASKASEVDNTITKTLGVLQENGVYACFLYLLASEKKNGQAVITEMLNLLEALEFPKPPAAGDSLKLEYIAENVIKDLSRLLLVKEALEQMLIYARYGAKAGDGQKHEEATMTWNVYEIVLRLHSPMHIGCGKVGYLQRTRPYVTGRVLRGALVSRVARNNPELISKDPHDPYRQVSKTFAQFLTFTYFYPALKNDSGYQPCFPWDNEARFRRRFLSSYTSTALSYPSQSADEGTLHEIEFISPHTLDDGLPVYLMGYVFVDEQRLKCNKYDWPGAFHLLQLGGERGYGWGDVRREAIRPISGDGNKLFGRITFDLHKKRPTLYLVKGQRLLAHTKDKTAPIAGHIEPIVGREWRAPSQAGRHLAFDTVCFAPGSAARQQVNFSIGKAGYWQWQKAA